MPDRDDATVDAGPATPDPASGRTTTHVPEPAGRFPTIPGYILLAELGRGGMGAVYRAREVRANRDVAVKLILSGQYASAAERARFQTEAEAAASIQHPGVVQVLVVGEHDGHPFLCMEFCGGGSLEQRLAGRSLPPLEAARLVEQLAEAVQAAHDRRVVHRDLKPANVLFVDDGRPKVTDFGLAKRLDGTAGLTASGAVMGTPSYMAPEQAAGLVQKVGPAADVYALGAILYRALTGRPPFQDDSVTGTLLRVMREAPVRPRAINKLVPRPLELVCLRCLSKRPQDRYATAADLAADLRRLLNNEPVLARPVRRFWPVALTCLALAGASVGLAVAAVRAARPEGGPSPPSAAADPDAGRAAAPEPPAPKSAPQPPPPPQPPLPVAARARPGFTPRKLADVVDTKAARVLYADEFDDPKASAFGWGEHARHFVDGRYTVGGTWSSAWGSSEHLFADVACELVGRTSQGRYLGWGVAMTNGPEAGLPRGEVRRGFEVLLNSEGGLLILPSRYIEQAGPPGPPAEPVAVPGFKPGEFNPLTVVLQNGRRLSVFLNAVEACEPIVLPYALDPAVVTIASAGGSTQGAKVELESYRVLSTVERVPGNK